MFHLSGSSFTRTTKPSLNASAANPYLSSTLSSPREVRSTDHGRELLYQADKKIAEQAERIRRLERMLTTDELTGVLNRQGLMSVLRRELAASRRSKRNMALLITMNIDDLDGINTRYGHAVGDAYLQSAAAVLLNEVRTTDSVARLEGDSFAVIMPQISTKEAARRLTQLEETFNKRMMHSTKLSLPLRGSFGFALITEVETPESLLVSADMALYRNRAKRKIKEDGPVLEEVVAGG